MSLVSSSPRAAPRWARRAWFALPLLAALAGCGALVGVDFTEATPRRDREGSRGGGTDVGSEPEVRDPSDPDCAEDEARACDGRCGIVLSVCGSRLDCGGCSTGETCGGGGPNVCGSGACAPDCVGKRCGEPDGCAGLCTEGSCASGQRCIEGVCRCDAWTCGAACATCAPGDTCVAGVCRWSETSRFVLFGGYAGGGLADTWEFDGESWAPRTPATAPPTRAGAAAAQLGGKLVVFGGNSNQRFIADTWTWDGQAWSEQRPRTSPAPRVDAAMAPFRGKLVLFGGRVLGSDSSETWEWDGQNWSQRTLPNGASPPARSGAVLSPLGGKLVLFGGTSSEPQKPARYLGDTWEWDGERWTQRSPRSSPPARNNGHMAPLGNRLVLFGGFGQPERDAIGEALSDTWEWDGENWSPKSPALSPSARSDAAFATFRGKLLLHGGTDYRSESFDDTWTWDGQRWSRLVPSRVPPTRRGAVSGTIP